MAFDGITIANLVYDMNQQILNGRISKIAQPEPDELLLTLKGNNGQVRLLLSASASLPLVYFTEENKPSPMTAPNFCMFLRKYIANGRIISITQPSFERIIQFEIEHLNELGDPCKKLLIIELMGKHSNIIFTDMDGLILESVKHVSGSTSSVREVLPGRTYFIPNIQHKENPLLADECSFIQAISTQETSVQKAIFGAYSGISPIAALELCYQADLDHELLYEELTEEQKLCLATVFIHYFKQVKDGNFQPVLISKEHEPLEYSSLPLTLYANEELEYPESISATLHLFYNRKEQYTRIRQKSVDLRRIVTTALDRNRKKYELQKKQYSDTEKKDKYKVYGELLHTYGYELTGGETKLEALNYYSNAPIEIPLDPQLNAQENAKKYFDKYNKLKRTALALDELLLSTNAEIEHLESVVNALEIAENEDDLIQIKEELILSGYIRKVTHGKRIKIISKPFHYVTADGFHIYVGKNNIQNDELTFKFANGGDWWFHAKGVPGSHVILKTEGKEITDATFEAAASLAAYYSKSRLSPKVEVDYLERKNVKKPAGAKPGFVVYYTNFSMNVSPNNTHLQLL